MAAFPWIISLLCAAAALFSSASPAPRSAQAVQPGQNVSLSCNFTSSNTITWYLLRSDRLLPLLTVEWSHIGKGQVVTFGNSDTRRLQSNGSLENGPVHLEILQVEEQDAGIYFCSWRLNGKVFINRGIHLIVQGVSVSAGAEGGSLAGLPCWTLWIWVLPALLVSCVMFMVGLCVYSGKPTSVSSCCCCRDTDGLRTAEDASLHYSSLRHTKQVQPSGQRGGGGGRGGEGGGGGGTGLVKEGVTYSTVASYKTPHGSHDHC